MQLVSNKFRACIACIIFYIKLCVFPINISARAHKIGDKITHFISFIKLFARKSAIFFLFVNLILHFKAF